MCKTKYFGIFIITSAAFLTTNVFAATTVKTTAVSVTTTKSIPGHSRIIAGEIIKITGTVKAISPQKKEHVLKLHSPLFPLDVIITGDKSFASLRFTDGTLLVLGPNSRLAIKAYQYKNPKSDTKTANIKNDVKINLESGEMKINAGSISRTEPKAFVIVTPVATVDLIRPTANIYYTPTAGFAFAGMGYILGSRGYVNVTSQSYAVIDQLHLSPTIVDTMPSVFTGSDAGMLNSIMQEDIATYGENSSFAGPSEFDNSSAVSAESLHSDVDVSDDDSFSGSSFDESISGEDMLNDNSPASDENDVGINDTVVDDDGIDYSKSHVDDGDVSATHDNDD